MKKIDLFTACDVLVSERVDMWDLTEYITLGEESVAGKQDAAWEQRWQKIAKRGTGFVNNVYKHGYESVLTSAGVLQYIAAKEL